VKVAQQSASVTTTDGRSHRGYLYPYLITTINLTFAFASNPYFGCLHRIYSSAYSTFPTCLTTIFYPAICLFSRKRNLSMYPHLQTETISHHLHHHALLRPPKLFILFVITLRVTQGLFPPFGRYGRSLALPIQSAHATSAWDTYGAHCKKKESALLNMADRLHMLHLSRYLTRSLPQVVQF
jgi:hypothetical protein